MHLLDQRFRRGIALVTTLLVVCVEALATGRRNRPGAAVSFGRIWGISRGLYNRSKT